MRDASTCTGSACDADDDPCRGSACSASPCAANPALCGPTEVCDPRADAATGCVPGKACASDRDCNDDDPCTQQERCDHESAVCRFDILDGDGDRHWPIVCGGQDCNDEDAKTHPGAVELCDGVDNDCDGEVDPPDETAPCGDDRTCVGHRCVCTDGLSDCYDACVDLQTDVEHCGRCGNDCYSSQTCSDGKCVDRDECVTKTARCPEHSTCMNKDFGYDCPCDDGYHAIGDTCVDTDECGLREDNCDSTPDACANTDGSFTCQCPDGYEGDGLGDTGCVDIDECLEADACTDDHALCASREGSFVCYCESGFTKVDDVCTNVDECAKGTDGCDESPGTCIDSAGSFTCECPSTYIKIADGTGTLGCASRVVALATGGTGSFLCGLLDGGRIECWGENDSGQLGTGDLVNRGSAASHLVNTSDAVDLGPGRTAKAVATGSKHTCAILDDDGIRCWGNNDHGQLGIGSNDTHGDVPAELGAGLVAVKLGTGRTAKTVVAGETHTCAILDDDTVKCWGANGLLGIDDAAARGGDGDAMGDTLPPVNLGSGRTAKRLTAGGDFTCAILDDDTVKCWGRNGSGQLGQGDDNARGWQPGDMAALLPVALGDGLTAKGIAAGLRHVCAILNDDSVKCWGSGYQGALGIEAYGNRGDSDNEMGDMLPIAVLGTGRTAKAVSAGAALTCAILDDDTAKCWGENATGELGQGNTSLVGEASGSMQSLPSIDLGTGSTPTAIRAGDGYACALLDGGRVKCWGSNDKGQLGQGENRGARGDQPNEMSDDLDFSHLGG